MARPFNLFFPTDEGALITGNGGHVSTADPLAVIPAVLRQGCPLAGALLSAGRRGHGSLAVDMGSASDSLLLSGGKKMVLYRVGKGVG